MTIALLLLLEHEHEVVAEAALHHHPVHSAGQIDLRRQKDDILAVQRGDVLMRVLQVNHHLVQLALPRARRAGARAAVRAEFADLLVLRFLVQAERHATAGRLVLAREHQVVSDLLHRQIPYIA